MFLLQRNSSNGLICRYVCLYCRNVVGTHSAMTVQKSRVGSALNARRVIRCLRRHQWDLCIYVHMVEEGGWVIII